MRVLIFTFEFVPFSGGIARYTHEVAAGLSRLGCEVRVLAPSYGHGEELDATATFSTRRMKVRHGGAELLRFVPGTIALRREIDRFTPDITLLTSDLAHGIGGVICARRGLPFVPVVHGSEVTKHFPSSTVKQRLQSIPLGYCYSRASSVLCVSEFVRSLLAGAGFAEDHLVVIHNGIDGRFVREPRNPARVARVRERFGIDGKTVLLTMARLVRRKGQAAMIEALRGVLVRHPDVRYVIAGIGEDADHLQTLTRSLGLEDVVVFTGAIDEVDKIDMLDACDVFVLPSMSDGLRVEGLGIALLEAGARGKPLIGGRHGGVPEIIEHGVTGYLVDATHPGQLEQSVALLLDDPDRAASMGHAVRDKIERGFLNDRMAAAVKERFESVLRAR